MIDLTPTPAIAAPNYGPLYAKIAKVMAGLHSVPKNGWNNFHSFAYVTVGDAYEAIRTQCGEHGLAIIPSITSVEREPAGKTGNGREQIRYIVNLSIDLCDSESGLVRSVVWRGESIDTDDKGVSKAVSSGMKYMLITTFLLSSDVDADASSPKSEAAADEPKGRSRASKPRNEPPPPAPVAERSPEQQAQAERLERASKWWKEHGGTAELWASMGRFKEHGTVVAHVLLGMEMGFETAADIVKYCEANLLPAAPAEEPKKTGEELAAEILDKSPEADGEGGYKLADAMTAQYKAKCEAVGLTLPELLAEAWASSIKRAGLVEWLDVQIAKAKSTKEAA